ncbi:hypothetical protein Bca52824_022178 [Brassica carinata]|uniref:S1 motif domain-containing protein n=1 Tax=Brassica carinata TaxID=52824 RepID=A0A8X7VG29_BRACI|nr:hypothetical protein Bca52824_022178 [Brassica carinata]
MNCCRFDVQNGGFVAEEEEHQLLNKSNHLLVNGNVEIVKDDDEYGVEVVKFARQGMPVVEIRTMIFAEVLGRTLGGRHQVRQIKQLNEPDDVKITECNIGGLLTRLEGLRGFIPKHELMKRVNNCIEFEEKEKLYNLNRGVKAGKDIF